VTTAITVAFDIDGTLLRPSDGQEDAANERVRLLVVLLRAMFPRLRLVAWSGGGADYAERIVRTFRLSTFFDAYAAKGALGYIPDIVIDDEEVQGLGLVHLVLGR
jgi:hypothetical protein